MKLTRFSEAKPTICFRATVLRPTLLTLSKSASAKFPLQIKMMVEGIINNFPFRTTLESDNKGGHRLKISTAVRSAARTDVGEIVTVEITRVGEEPETRVPMDLRKALATAPLAKAQWKKITPMARRDWILSICVVRQAETRTRRIEKTCDMLASGKGRVCCFPGINWLTKDHVTREETWLPLPKEKK